MLEYHIRYASTQLRFRATVLTFEGTCFCQNKMKSILLPSTHDNLLVAFSYPRFYVVSLFELADGIILIRRHD